MLGVNLEPLSFGALLDAAVRLWLRHFPRLFGLALLSYAPTAIVAVGLIVTSPPANSPLWLLYGGAWMLCWSISGALLLSCASDLVTGRRRTVKDHARVLMARLWTLCIAQLLSGLATVLGFVLLIIPGLVLFLLYALVPEVIVIENLGAWDALRRSSDLVKRARWRVLGLVMILMVMGGVLSGMVEGLSQLALGAAGPELPLGFLGNVLFDPFGAVAFVLLYYDIRVRTEGFALESLDAEMVSPAASSDS